MKNFARIADILQETGAVRMQRTPASTSGKATPNRGQTKGTCPVCGFKIRGPNHEQGAQHQKALRP